MIDRRTRMLKIHLQKFQSFICTNAIGKLSIPHRKCILEFGMDGKDFKISLADYAIQMLTECEKNSNQVSNYFNLTIRTPEKTFVIVFF
jgi:hypothetical protein